MYNTFMHLIKFGNQNEDIKFIVVTGKGKNYSSGNDLSNFTNPKYALGTVEEMAACSAEGLMEMTATVINS